MRKLIESIDSLADGEPLGKQVTKPKTKNKFLGKPFKREENSIEETDVEDEDKITEALKAQFEDYVKNKAVPDTKKTFTIAGKDGAFSVKNEKGVTVCSGSKSDCQTYISKKNAELNDAKLDEARADRGGKWIVYRSAKDFKVFTTYKGACAFQNKWGNGYKVASAEWFYDKMKSAPAVDESVVTEAHKDTIEAHGIRGMDRRPWQRTFKNVEAMEAWCEKFDAEVYGTRDTDFAAQGRLAPAIRSKVVSDVEKQIEEEVDSIDMTGKTCKKCHKGRYQETSQMDDMDGVLHCTKCGSEIKRHYIATSPHKREVSDLQKRLDAGQKKRNKQDSTRKKPHLQQSQTVDEGYWDEAMKKFEKGQADRKAAYAKDPNFDKDNKNPASHDKNGVYKGDKDLAGNPVPRKVREDDSEWPNNELGKAQQFFQANADADMDFEDIVAMMVDAGFSEEVAADVALDSGRVQNRGLDEAGEAKPVMSKYAAADELSKLHVKPSAECTMDDAKRATQLAKITGRAFMTYGDGGRASCGYIVDRILNAARNNVAKGGKMPDFTGAAPTTQDFAKQVALQTNGVYRSGYGRTWITGYGDRYKDPTDFIEYSTKDGIDDAWAWVESKGKKIHYKQFDTLLVAVQIGRYIIENSSITHGAFSNNPRESYKLSVRTAKSLSTGQRFKQDITDQQAAALQDIAATKTADAFNGIKMMMAVLKGEDDVKSIISNSKKIHPNDKAKLDAIIAQAGNFKESVTNSRTQTEGIGDTIRRGVKSVKRGLQGWDKNAVGPNGERLGDPRAVLNRAKNLNDKDVKSVYAAINAPGQGLYGNGEFKNPHKHSPAGLQKRGLEREIKKRGLGEDSSGEPNTDSILECLTKAYRRLQKIAHAYQDFSVITRVYENVRSELMAGNFAGFEKEYDYCLRRFPDAATELFDAMYAEAGLPEEQGSYEQFMQIMSESKKPKRSIRESFVGLSKKDKIHKMSEMLSLLSDNLKQTRKKIGANGAKKVVDEAPLDQEVAPAAAGTTVQAAPGVTQAAAQAQQQTPTTQQGAVPTNQQASTQKPAPPGQPVAPAQQAPAQPGQQTVAAAPGQPAPPKAGQPGGAPVAAPPGTPGPATGGAVNAASTPMQNLVQTVTQLSQDPAAAKQAAIKLGNAAK